MHMHKKKAGYTFLHDAYVHVNRHWIENLHDTRTWHRIGNFYIAYVASSISNISTMIHRKVFTRSTNPFISPRASFPRGMEFFYSKDIVCHSSDKVPITRAKSQILAREWWGDFINVFVQEKGCIVRAVTRAHVRSNNRNLFHRAICTDAYKKLRAEVYKRWSTKTMIKSSLNCL